jgi:HEAT repeat protein
MNRKTWHLIAIAVLCSGALFATACAICTPVDVKERSEREAQLIEILESDASRAEKDEACRELQIVGSPACIPTLAALLPDEDFSHMARCALEPMSHPQAGQALRDALAKTTGMAKVGVIGSLGFREDKKAVPELIALVESSDIDVAGAAVAALGRIGTPEAVRSLEALRAGAAGPLRAVVAEASLTAAERLLRCGEREEAAAIYEDLLAPEWPEHARLGAFEGLLKARPDEAVDRAVLAIGGDDPTLRSVAIAGMATLKGQGVAQRLVEELPGASDEVQVLLIGALAERGDAAACPAVVKATADPSQDVRLAALKALGGIGDATSVEALCKAVAEGENAAEKETAVESLERLGGDGVDAALLARMRAAPAGARAELIDVLAARGADGAVDSLLEEATKGDARVRASAFKALGQLAETSDLPALLELLVELEGDKGRGEAEGAVTQVSRKIADQGAQADAALAALNEATAAPARGSLLRVLGGIANEPAFDVVRDALDDEAPETRDVAVRVLSDWPDARALDAVLGEFRTTKNRTHRVLALRGSVRLLGLSDRPKPQTLKIYRELMKAVEEPKDMKLVLSGLGDVADPAALKMVEPHLDDPQVAAEAEQAMLGIARGIVKSAPAEARQAAIKLRKQSKNNDVLKEAGKIVRETAPPKPEPKPKTPPNPAKRGKR